MSETTISKTIPAVPPSLLGRSVALMKPVTWFAPGWAFLCGSIASGTSTWAVGDIGRIALGVFLAGPILCGLSQVVNDWCDREVDAINEPQRLIPSGLVTTRQVVVTISVLAVVALGIARYLGEPVALLTAIGMVLAVIYSAHPIRAKRNGWVGNALVAISYEGLPWLAGALTFAPLTLPNVIIAVLYSVGAHGIMTINDFKSIEGDRQMGIRTIPVQLGPWGAAWIAVLTMDAAQLFVILNLAAMGEWITAGIITALLLGQLPLQATFIRAPREKAIFYNATGTMLFVWGMLAAAIGLR
jgi:chlorophyll synthase